ncbi:hypothetical protein LOAG_06179 [Loa loa]|uniref:Uncharacterized protein n=1 Tax=Loa loa TaxID=7209 RepID=A0A1S0TYY2_LOALO|nr:hypothetical protein LOAG_06179 [Loa loa]EFO22304.1 hypothetical protein LOAG_06179 [Loa loa]
MREVNGDILLKGVGDISPGRCQVSGFVIQIPESRAYSNGYFIFSNHYMVSWVEVPVPYSSFIRKL